MSKLRALFIVQGEGRGHLTQALALGSILRKAGHSVCKAVVSKGGHEIPEYFETCLETPVIEVPSGRFFVDQETRSIDWGRTLVNNSLRWTEFNRGFTVLSELLETERPDIIVNFFEPLAGFFMLRERSKIPMVAVGHQFMFLHPQYQFPAGFEVQKISTLAFTRMIGLGAECRFALSLYDAPRLPDKKIVVMPPLLRQELFDLPDNIVSEPYYLVYLYHHSLSKDLIAWHERNPAHRLHCFWNNDEAEETTYYSSTLTFHRLHGSRFLEMMARCQGVVTTSGFESMAEAMYLHKPLMLNPLHRHFEQHCNGIDGVNMGAAIQSSNMNLDRLIDFVPNYDYDATELRNWIGKAEEMYVRELEKVAFNRT